MAERELVITGPTASGKSALAMAVAQRLGGEIISMDSRQVYRGMDVGTAKPDAAERQAVPHLGLDLIDPGDRYSAGQFARDARGWITDIRARAHVPVIAGGTLFFLRALQQPLFDEPPLDSMRRDALREYLNGRPLEELRTWAAAIADPNDVDDATLPVDRQRLARLIEVVTLTGRTLAQWHRNVSPDPGIQTLTFVMTLDRDELYRRINDRVHNMVERGFVAEVQGLVAQGYGPQHPGMNATGYLELLLHVAGDRSLDEAITLIQAATRQYARRQLTWIRTQLGGQVYTLDASLPIPQLAQRVETVWREEVA